jgi:hypothetical protein
VPISTMAMKSFQRIASLIPKNTPVIIESSITSELLDEEIGMALASLGDGVVSSALVSSSGQCAS